MQKMDNPQKKIRFRCPECSNYINGVKLPNGSVAGQCRICKAVVLEKQRTPKETQIRIIKKS